MLALCNRYRRLPTVDFVGKVVCVEEMFSPVEYVLNKSGRIDKAQSERSSLLRHDFQDQRATGTHGRLERAIGDGQRRACGPRVDRASRLHTELGT